MTEITLEKDDKFKQTATIDKKNKIIFIANFAKAKNHKWVGLDVIILGFSDLDKLKGLIGDI